MMKLKVQNKGYSASELEDGINSMRTLGWTLLSITSHRHWWFGVRYEVWFTRYTR